MGHIQVISGGSQRQVKPVVTSYRFAERGLLRVERKCRKRWGIKKNGLVKSSSDLLQTKNKRVLRGLWMFESGSKFES